MVPQHYRPGTPTTTSVTTAHVSSRSEEEENSPNAILTHLYSSDLHVLQLSDSKQEQDDISSIMELHNVDLQVDSSVSLCKNSKLSLALLNDLLKTDQAIDGVQSYEQTDMVDPFSQQI